MLYVKNFRENDYLTHIVFEDDEGKMMILDINIDGIKAEAGKLHIIDGNDAMTYQANQYKKDAVLVKTLIPLDYVEIIEDEKREEEGPPINEFHPIVCSGWIFQTTRIIGGSKDGKWYQMADFIQEDDLSFKKAYKAIDLAKGGEIYKFYSPFKFLFEEKGTQPIIYISEYSGIEVEVTFEPKDLGGQVVMGINGDWDAMPRKLERIDENTYSVDLDNDGDKETIMLVDKGADEKTFQIMLKDKMNTFILESMEYYNELPTITLFTLDLDGNGSLEIITKSIVTGSLLYAYEYKNKEINTIFRWYNGD